MRIAIIGTGISGLSAAYRLSDSHDVTIYEARDRLGGHANTVTVEDGGRSIPVDTGFIVFNKKNYPRFTALLTELGVGWQPSNMSFSFSCRKSGLEYRGGQPMAAMFVQRSNLFRGSFHMMIREILRFNRTAPQLVNSPPDLSLGDFLFENQFSQTMVNDYLLPMAAAIWSAPARTILEFPARQFGHFFRNHGLLQVRNRPQWMTVAGGSREYVRAISGKFRDSIRLSSPVEQILRYPDHVTVKARGSGPEKYDGVVLACHSDQALGMLGDASRAEHEILRAIRYQSNEAVLHTDRRLLPKRTKAWAAWNYHRFAGDEDRATVTYNMSLLQNLPTSTQYLVTLNTEQKIRPDQVLQRFIYDHPLFDRDGMAAQKRWPEINGQQRTWYCGAYWGYGFHEDGINSAWSVCDSINSS